MLVNWPSLIKIHEAGFLQLRKEGHLERELVTPASLQDSQDCCKAGVIVFPPQLF